MTSARPAWSAGGSMSLPVGLRNPIWSFNGSNDAVYATSGYSGSASNLAQTSLATDNVFSDGTSLQVPSITGSIANGYAASMIVAIAR
jgi:hypothetical protein